jgi:hypothetical protein
VVVRVALSWRDDDKRWKSIWQPVLKGVAGQVAARLVRAGHDVSANDVVEFRKLRASAGHYVLESIEDAIAEADVLIFDLSPRPGEIAGPANVLLELGISVAQRHRVFLASERPSRTMAACSDLAGLYVARITGKSVEQSLRMALASRVLQVWTNRRSSSSRGVSR